MSKCTRRLPFSPGRLLMGIPSFFTRRSCLDHKGGRGAAAAGHGGSCGQGRAGKGEEQGQRGNTARAGASELGAVSRPWVGSCQPGCRQRPVEYGPGNTLSTISQQLQLSCFPLQPLPALCCGACCVSCCVLSAALRAAR